MRAYQAAKQHFFLGRAHRVSYEPFTGGYSSFTPTPSAKAIEKNLLSKDMASSTKSRKRKSGRRRRKVIRRTRIPTGIPQKQVVKLKTSWLGQHNPAAGTLGADVIALNGAFDPMLAFGSQQPLYYDQWSAMYRRYCVIGWKIRFQIATTDNTNPTVFGFCPTTGSTALASHMYYKEIAGNKSVICTPDVDKNYLTVKGSVKKYLHPNSKRVSLLDDPNTYQLTSANPTNVVYGHIYTQAFDATADPAVINYCATLEQIIVFFDPVVPARS